MYHDRLEAGTVLAEELAGYRGGAGVVLAVPRGGVPVAYAVAKALSWPLDLLLTKKIGHPLNQEYAIGSVSLTDTLIDPHEDIPRPYIDQETKRIRLRLKEMYKKFMGNKEPEKLGGKTLVIVDDGAATGNTLMSTINMLKKGKPHKIIIALPVASRSAYEKLAGAVDEIICPLVPGYFGGVGAFYENFEQVSDDEVMHYLKSFRTMEKRH